MESDQRSNPCLQDDLTTLSNTPELAYVAENIGIKHKKLLIFFSTSKIN